MFSILNTYPSFLVFLATVFSAVITIVVTPIWIKILKSKAIGQQVRNDGPKTHLIKQGTPTMGGVVMLIAITVSVFLVCKPSPDVMLLMGAILLTGVVGLVDDVSKIIFQRSLGLTPPQKLVVQFLIATTFCLFAVNYLGIPPTVDVPLLFTLDCGVLSTTLPIGDGFTIPWIYLILINLLVAGLANAVNLTDGLDGLASGTIIMSMVVFVFISYREDQLACAVVSAAMVGSCVGFLWHNAFPADIFMGDTGSLAFGTALGCLSILTKTEFLALVIGALYIVEALSVMIQVAYFKKTGKRIFLMAPLHHHFEKMGWSETRVVMRFWIIAGFFAAVGFVWFFVGRLVG